MQSGLTINLGPEILTTPLCISQLASGYAQFPVGLQGNATWAYIEKSSCNLPPAALAALYQDKAIDYQSYLHNCASPANRVGKLFSDFNTFARDAQASLMISLLDRADTTVATPGFGTNVIAEAMGDATPVLFLECQFVPGQQAGYVVDFIFNNRTEVFVDFTLDMNPYLAVFNSPAYIAVIVVLGVIYLGSGALAALFLFRRLTNPRYVNARTPQLLLAIEFVVLTFLGAHLVAGRWASNPDYPTDLHLALFQLLYGSSLGTSVLAGVFYEDVYVQSMKFKPSGMNSFWKRNRRSLLVVAILCLGLDVGSTLASIFFIDNVSVILGSINVLALLVLGIVFIRKTSRFVIGARGMLDVKADKAAAVQSSEYASSKNKRLDIISRWLFLSAVSMLLTIVMYGVLGISGTLIPGVYEPVPYAVIWVVYIILRWLPSFCQIMLTYPVSGRRSSKGSNSKRSKVSAQIDIETTSNEEKKVTSPTEALPSI